MSTRNGSRSRMRLAAAAAAVCLCVAGAAAAQRGGFFGGRGRTPAIHNAPYDGRFAFVRLKYETAPGGYWYRGLPAWAHGFPVSEQNLMKIMREVTYLDAHANETDVLTLDDPNLFKYPVAYIIEVSWWAMTDR